MTERPDQAGVVADADVLAADLLVGGDARRALDLVREHSWLQLYASAQLLDDAEFLIEQCADAELAAAWRERIESLVEPVDQPAGDHPALATAYHSHAAHVLSFDEELRSARTGVALKRRIDVSVMHPGGFATLFDPSSFYEDVVGGEYPGPDRDPRA